MTISDKFAVSLVSLALLKKGYSTYKGVPPGMGAEADILVVGNGERFAVEVKVLDHIKAMPRRLEELREQLQTELGATTYFAFLVDQETRLLVDRELLKRMHFHDKEVRLEELPMAIEATSKSRRTVPDGRPFPPVAKSSCR
jgi:hypothetical protein